MSRERNLSGTVSSVFTDRGFGFIREDGSGRSLFFHVSRLAGGLEMDEQLRERNVLFDVGEDRRGRDVAVNIRPAR
jgi:cold shock CspA family protein